MAMEIMNKRRLNYAPIHLHHVKNGSPHTICTWTIRQGSEKQVSHCLSDHVSLSCPSSYNNLLHARSTLVNGKVSLDLSGNWSVPDNPEWPSIAPDGQPDGSHAHAWMDCMCSDRTTARICLDLAFGVRPRSRTAMFCISVPGRQDSSALFCKTSRQKLW